MSPASIHVDHKWVAGQDAPSSAEETGGPIEGEDLSRHRDPLVSAIDVLIY